MILERCLLPMDNLCRVFRRFLLGMAVCIAGVGCTSDEADETTATDETLQAKIVRGAYRYEETYGLVVTGKNIEGELGNLKKIEAIDTANSIFVANHKGGEKYLIWLTASNSNGFEKQLYDTLYVPAADGSFLDFDNRTPEEQPLNYLWVLHRGKMGLFSCKDKELILPCEYTKILPCWQEDTTGTSKKKVSAYVFVQKDRADGVYDLKQRKWILPLDRSMQADILPTPTFFYMVTREKGGLKVKDAIQRKELATIADGEHMYLLNDTLAALKIAQKGYALYSLKKLRSLSAPVYDSLALKTDLLFAQEQGQWYCAPLSDLQKKLLLTAPAGVMSLGSDLIAVPQNGRFKIYSFLKESYWPGSFEQVAAGAGSTVAVNVDGKYGLYSKEGNQIIVPQFQDMIWDPVEQRWSAILPDDYFYFDRHGNLIEDSAVKAWIEVQGNIYKVTYGLDKGSKLWKRGLKDKEGNYLLPCIYDEIIVEENRHLKELVIQGRSETVNDKYLKIRKGNLWGMYSLAEKRWLIPVAYTSISLCADNYYFVSHGEKQGIFDVSTGKQLLKPIYENIKYTEGCCFFATLNGRYGLASVKDGRERVLLPFRYDAIDKWGWWTNSNLYRATIANKDRLVCIDFQEDKIIELIPDGYSDILTDYHEAKEEILVNKKPVAFAYRITKSLLLVVTGKAGIFDLNQKRWILPKQYDWIEPYKHFCLLYQGERVSALNLDEKRIVDTFESIEVVGETFLAAAKRQKGKKEVWLYDSKMNLLLPFPLDNIRPVKDLRQGVPENTPGAYAVEGKGLWAILSKEGILITDFEYEEVSACRSDTNEFFVRKNGKESWIKL